jgi:chorismate mutase
MKEWMSQWGRQPLVIAGPCSAETYDQLYTTAKAVRDQGIKLVRAGVWKPRTRPNNFEGVGEEALFWMDDIRKELDVAFAIEVGNPQHVELALKHDIDVLWIGARSTVNPFTVQEIAEALTGTDKPILVKNPINPELALWFGALERLANRNIKNLGAIHRGFSFFGESRYRNVPAWHMAIELKREMPDLPLICDPSHISGDRNMIQEISQVALDLNYDGLIIETHPDPVNAWSDAKQQVNPAMLHDILRSLRYPEAASEHPEYRNKLEEIRHGIDTADREILEALHRRMQLVDQIGEYKRAHNLTVLDLDRWQEILESRQKWGKHLNLKKSFIRDLYMLIHQGSIRRQTKIMNKE